MAKKASKAEKSSNAGKKAKPSASAKNAKAGAAKKPKAVAMKAEKAQKPAAKSLPSLKDKVASALEKVKKVAGAMTKSVKPSATSEKVDRQAKLEPEESAENVVTAELTVEIEEVTTPEVSVKKEKKEKKERKKRENTKAAEKLASEELEKWTEFQEKFGNEKASTYIMSGQFEAQKPLVHKVLGWGFIISNNNDRLEVLFESGKKMLISNYQQK